MKAKFNYTTFEFEVHGDQVTSWEPQSRCQGDLLTIRADTMPRGIRYPVMANITETNQSKCLSNST